MKEIHLSNGGVAKVSDEDYERLSAFKWFRHALGYAFRKVKHPTKRNLRMYMHREVMNNPPCIIDHINRDRLDNQRSNLRHATKSLNALNNGPQSNNTSGVRGVDYIKHTDKWCARLKAQGKQHFLGYFKDKTDAIAARQAAEAKFIK